MSPPPFTIGGFPRTEFQSRSSSGPCTYKFPPSAKITPITPTPTYAHLCPAPTDRVSESGMSDGDFVKKVTQPFLGADWEPSATPRPPTH